MAGSGSLKEKTAKGLFWGGVSSGAQQLVGLIAGIVLARTLYAEDYGLVGMLGIFMGIAGTIINSGFSVALTNKKDAGQEDYDAVFWFTVFTGLALYAVLFFSAPLIADFFGRQELVSLSRMVFLGFVFSGISTVSYTVMFKQLMVKQQAKVEVLSLSVACTVGVVLALKGYAYWALAIQMVIQQTLGAVLRCWLAPWRPTFHFSFRPLRAMLPFSIKLFLTGLFVQVNANIFSVLLGKFYNATQLGFYSQGQKWMGMGQTFIGGMINNVSQPVLVQVQGDRERQVAVLRKLIRFGAFVSFPLMLGLAFIGREFILITIGEKWLPSIPFLQLFCLWGAVSFLWTLYTNLVFTHGKSNTYMYVTMAFGIVQLAVVATLSFWGIFPMVVGHIVMNFAGLLVWHRCTERLIGLRLRDMLRDVLPYLLITLACLCVAWLATRGIRNLYLLCLSKIAISALLYILVMKFGRSAIFKESMEFLSSKRSGCESGK